MKYILIGNYKPDKQESMHRYALMLQRGFTEAGYSTEIVYPTVLLGRWAGSTTSGISKWLGYVDKWIIFAVVLKFKLLLNGLFASNKNIHYHICDHSNAPYLALLPTKRTVITCHDVLAIQGAMGIGDSYCEASATGKILQRWILYYLARAPQLAAVSAYTLQHLVALASNAAPKNKLWVVIPNAFNATFYPMPVAEARSKLAPLGLANSPFVLHVGSSLPRKNREMLLHFVHQLGDSWAGKICFAGQPLEEAHLLALTKQYGLESSIVSAAKPDHTTLVALYSACEAFIFPSFSEGFGWPLIEAQACGAPVIASKVDPLPEVTGGAALHADPLQPEAFAAAFHKLQNEEVRAKLIANGFENCKRYETGTIIRAYLDVHERTR